MARLARIVVPGLPHHVTQREAIFFEDDDQHFPAQYASGWKRHYRHNINDERS